MLRDKIPDYFDQLVDELLTEYGNENVSYTRTYTDSPQSFPHIYFKRLNSSDALPTLSGTKESKGINNTVEIHAYHNKGISMAEDFAFFVRRVMTEKVGMECDYFNQMDNVSDSKIIQFVMRFSSLSTETE